MANFNQFSNSNGASIVTILDAPAASTSRTCGAGWINVANPDDANAVSFTLTANVAGNVYTQEPLVTLAAQESWSNDKQVFCLDAVDQTLELYLSNVASQELDISVLYRDESQ